jgi:uncharacterized caspase-like protein
MQAILKWFLGRTVRWLLVYVVMSAAAIMPLSAQDQDKGFVVKGLAQPIASAQGTRWALLVGIAKYPSVEGFEIQQLKAPVKDVNALAAFLKDPEKGGFDADHVFTLTDEEATRRKILITFNDIKQRAAPEDMVLFYFSGHGAPPGEDGTTYLIPYDHDLRDVQTTCINFTDLAEKIRRMEASKVVVILDACHSGGVKPENAKSTPDKGISDAFLKAFQESEGRALLLSSDESEVSWEDEESGIFTRFLLEGLNGKADADDDGIVSFTETALYVENTVREYTRENFPRVQRPTRRHLGDKERGEIPLAINWGKVARLSQQELLKSRNEAIFRASLEGLDQNLQEFSLQVAQSACDKALSGEELTKRELLLLQQIDRLKDGTITAADYIARAPAIYEIGLTQLRIAVTPTDARITLTPANAPDRVISPSLPNVYKIEQGRYRLSAERPGYAPHSQEITLDQGSEMVKVALDRLMGTLRLQVNPADATVMVIPLNIAAPDTEIRASKSIRVHPTGGSELPVGTYRLTAEKEGYESAIKENVEIKANATTQITLALKQTPVIVPVKPKPATIVGPDLPDGTRVFVNGEFVALPHEFPPGTYRIRLERDGFQPVEMSETLMPAQLLSLRPEWVPTTPMKPSEILKPPATQGGIPRVGAFAASLVVPGLGQHFQRRHVRAGLYEAAAVGAGAAAIWAMINYQGALDDYKDVQDRLEIATREEGKLTPRIRELFDEQKSAHDEAESARTLSIATQIALGVVWGINALDAGIIEPAGQSDGFAFEAHPTSDGAQILVRAPF